MIIRMHKNYLWTDLYKTDAYRNMEWRNGQEYT